MSCKQTILTCVALASTLNGFAQEVKQQTEEKEPILNGTAHVSILAYGDDKERKEQYSFNMEDYGLVSYYFSCPKTWLKTPEQRQKDIEQIAYRTEEILPPDDRLRDDSVLAHERAVLAEITDSYKISIRYNSGTKQSHRVVSYVMTFDSDGNRITPEYVGSVSGTTRADQLSLSQLHGGYRHEKKAVSVAQWMWRLDEFKPINRCMHVHD